MQWKIIMKKSGTKLLLDLNLLIDSISNNKRKVENIVNTVAI